jgi:hypothetical protein
MQETFKHNRRRFGHSGAIWLSVGPEARLCQRTFSLGAHAPAPQLCRRLRVRGWMIGEIGREAPDAPYVKLNFSMVKRAMRSSFGI